MDSNRAGGHKGRLAFASFTILVCIISIAASSAALRPLLVVAILAAGGLLVWIIRSNALTLKTLVIGTVLFRILLLWLPPTLSDDVYRYIWDGRVQLAGMNPYQHLPSDLVDAGVLESDVVYDRMNSKDLYTVYPPVSQFVFVGAAVVENAVGSWWGGYYFIKLIFALVELAAALLILSMVRSSRALLYAWNPLVLIESAGQPHTEAMLVLLLVAAIWYSRKHQAGKATIALAVAVLVKIYPLFLLPLSVIKSNWKKVAIAIVVGVVCLVPYLGKDVAGNVQSSLDLYVRLFEFNAGLYLFVKKVMFEFTGADFSKTIGPLFRNLFFIVSIAVWFASWRKRWPLERGIRWILGAFILFATTVHPWYLLGILCTLPFADVSKNTLASTWNWYALGIIVPGTYLFYTHDIYWLFVVAGWTTWTVITFAGLIPIVANRLVHYRARSKYSWIRPYLKPDFKGARVLDLGAGEGYLGQMIGEKHSANVELVDVVDFSSSTLPLTIYDGRHLPYADRTFDTAIVYFVLHHAEDAEQVLREAVRVTGDRLVVVESTYTSKPGHVVLRFLDRAANRLRSSGLMAEAEEYLHFRKKQEWLELFETLGLDLEAVEQKGTLVHRQVLFVLKVPG